FADCAPQATIHYWQRLPAGVDAIEFAQKLLDPSIAVVCTPGPWLADEDRNGVHAGLGYVRFSMVPSREDTKRACDAIRANRDPLLR
ncbi:MAG: hypothetical protein OER88_10665, partial [Planctomycetota bacterium]|nr:hypothetical protein [Planctomycetota bacterium]